MIFAVTSVVGQNVVAHNGKKENLLDLTYRNTLDIKTILAHFDRL